MLVKKTTDVAEQIESAVGSVIAKKGVETWVAGPHRRNSPPFDPSRRRLVERRKTL